MGIINKIMATVGIGNVSVDTVIENPSLCAGEEVMGSITVKGGIAPQNIGEIYLYVMTKVEKESNNIKFVGKEKLQKVTIPVNKTIASGDNINIPFSFILNWQTPFTTLKTPVWIHTGLDIKSALDPKDNDSLKICAGIYLQAVLNAFERLELVIYKVENVEDFYYSTMPFLQKIEFRPTGSLKYDLNYLKMMYVYHATNLELIMDIGNVYEGVDLEDKKIILHFEFEDLKNKDPYELSQLISAEIFKNDK
ncbi:MAG: sporulation protein [Clostridiaceae bacterium]